MTVIAYGADGVVSADEAPVRALGLEPGRFATVIARAEPENSLLEIVSGFSRKPRGMNLVVLGGMTRRMPISAGCSKPRVMR